MIFTGIMIFLAGAWLEIALTTNFQNGRIVAFVDMPSIVAIILPIIAVIVVTGEYKTFITGLNAVFSKEYDISAADKENAIKLFKLLGKTTIYSAVFSSMIGGISILLNLSLDSIGAKIALILISTLYATFINLILINPAIHILEKRHNTEGERVISEKQIMDKLLEMCYMQGVSSEEIIDAKEICFKK